ncbi:THUMP domain-containing protein [Pyrolobus fumarii]|uniref:THUMP domain-containing protein n=1 Tax=Pyrolobus fumarii TaxID=54252 RepID=UPI001432EDA7|nr:THUMP domain-containing protein [Pyrolobus fumarii]
MRYAEIGVKLGRTRQFFEESLARSIRCWLAYAGLIRPIRITPGRIIIDVEELEEAFEAAKLAARSFGVHSAAPAWSIPNDLNTILEMIPRLFRDELVKASTFAVRARRVESYPVKSRDVERLLGARILEAIPSLRVDLEKPDVIVRLEIRAKRAYAYLDSWLVEGPGGLPYGVEGTAVIPVLEGSLDELLAAWLVARRGARLYFVVSGERARDVVKRFVNAWVPCGDAIVEESEDPWRLAAKLAARGAALLVYPHVISVDVDSERVWSVSPLVGAPEQIVSKAVKMLTSSLHFDDF